MRVPPPMMASARDERLKSLAAKQPRPAPKMGKDGRTSGSVIEQETTRAARPAPMLGAHRPAPPPWIDMWSCDVCGEACASTALRCTCVACDYNVCTKCAGESGLLR